MGSFGRSLAGDAVIVVQSQPWRICGASVWLFGACSQMKTLTCEVLEKVQLVLFYSGNQSTTLKFSSFEDVDDQYTSSNRP